MKKKNPPWDKGLIQVYTGDGKGKSTAAFGLSLRCAGAGIPVFIAQFAKGRLYSEHEGFKHFPGLITVRQYGNPGFIVKTPDQQDIGLARQGLSEVRKILEQGDYPLVILDEANIAVYYNLFTSEELIDVLLHRHNSVEVVVTGRNASESLIACADLVTEMKLVKHYFDQGIASRPGIEE